jgi:hypothetical protein
MEGRAKAAALPPKHALTLTAISITAPALFYLPTSMLVAFYLTYFLATAKESKQRKPSLLKFLTAKNDLFLGRCECVPSSSTQMTSLSFAPRISHSMLKL